jgi:DNA modification methylase
MSQAINKNIMDWTEFPEYDLLYTDPPWGTRMVKWFNGLYAKDTGQAANDTFSDLYNQLAARARLDKPLLIEYQVKGWEEIVEIMMRSGHAFTGKHERLQSMGRPFVILSFNCSVTFGEQTKGFDLVIEAVRQLNAKTVFDPFAGIGKTAEAVIKAGASYIGSEYNPKRFEKLQKVIRQYENL